MCTVGEFLSLELLADCLLIRLHVVVAWEYETIFNTEYFIINRKIIGLCSRNRSAVLTCTCIKTHSSSCLLERGNDRHTPIPTFYLACTNIHFGARFLLPLPGSLPLHTQRGRVVVSLFIYLFICWSSRIWIFLPCYHYCTMHLQKWHQC